MLDPLELQTVESWELNPGSLKKQPVFLNAGPSQPQLSKKIAF